MRHDDDGRALGTAERLDGGERERSPRLHPTLVVAAQPTSERAEAFRGLYYALRRAAGGEPLGLLGVVSSARGEGRSTVAGNLALAAARESGRPVGLVDADLRAPRLHRLFDVEGDVGLSDVLANRADFEAVLVEQPATGIGLVPGGRIEPEPARRFTNPRFPRFVSQMRHRYDEVILDLPPLAFADARLLSPLCSGVVMVVRAGRTEEALVREAIAGLEGSRLFGTVLNGAADAVVGNGMRALPGGR